MLRNAYFSGYNEAMCFLIMIKVLASEGFHRDRSFCSTSADCLLFYWGKLGLRLIPPGLDYMFTCLF